MRSCTGDRCTVGARGTLKRTALTAPVLDNAKDACERREERHNNKINDTLRKNHLNNLKQNELI